MGQLIVKKAVILKMKQHRNNIKISILITLIIFMTGTIIETIRIDTIRNEFVRNIINEKHDRVLNVKKKINMIEETKNPILKYKKDKIVLLLKTEEAKRNKKNSEIVKIENEIDNYLSEMGTDKDILIAKIEIQDKKEDKEIGITLNRILENYSFDEWTQRMVVPIIIKNWSSLNKETKNKSMIMINHAMEFGQTKRVLNKYINKKHE